MFKQYLKDNTCFIVPNNIKRDILLYISKNKILVNICFFNINEMKKKIFFDYDEKSVYYLAKEFNIGYDEAQMMIENMYYISDKYTDNKISKLREMKEYLDNEGLLYYDYDFINYLNNKKIVTSYGKTSFFNDKIFDLLSNVEYISSKEDLKEVCEFSFVDEEVEYVAHSICELIDKGIDVNKIKLVNVSKEYSSSIKKIFSYYNLSVDLKEKTSLYDLNIVRDFINMLSGFSKEEALETFKNKYNNIDIYNEIINTLNKCYFTNDIDFIIREFKNSFISSKRLNNCIDCLKIEEMYDSDNYYFLLGFNNSVPRFYKDEDYISDSVKDKLGFKTSNDINKQIKKYYISRIKSISNLFISYRLTDYFNSYLVSSLLSDVSKSLVKNPKMNFKVSYSSKFDQIKLAKGLDDFYKYSLKNENLGALINNCDKDIYDSYDNSFKGINKDEYMESINNKISLSYSSLDNYYKCGFKYYLNNLLKENESNFYSLIGNLYHYVLSKIYDDNFDFNKEYNSFLSNENVSDKEEVLLIKLKEELKTNVLVLKEQLNKSDFKICKCEEEISVYIKSKASVRLIGYIDKIMLTEDKKYAYVVDYKTGKPEISFDYLEHGLGMQLAVYMYLLNKSKDYADVFLVGCYLQRILIDDLNKEEIKLDGYTFNDINIIKSIDNNYTNKSFLSGVKVNSKGEFSKTSKLFNEEEYTRILSVVETKLQEAINGICSAEFKINPKVIKGKNISCSFCKYNDICYHAYKDNVIISGGDEDE